MAKAAVLSPTAIPDLTYPELADSSYRLEKRESTLSSRYGRFLGSQVRARQVIRKALQDRIDAIDPASCEAGEEDAFFVADLGEVYRQHMRWKQHLVRVRPYYAVKCNMDHQVLRLLRELGGGFDCASKVEMETVLKLGAHPSDVIYAQPCKTVSHLRYSHNKRIGQMTFDNADELKKIQAYHPKAELFLRIETDDSASLCKLSQKFGANRKDALELLEKAKEYELQVVGVAFHVGSGASDPKAFSKAVMDARKLIDVAPEYGHCIATLDIGGGFLADETFEIMAKELSAALNKHIPEDIKIIGEPGRFYVAKAFTLACHVIGRRTVFSDNENLTSCKIYINDGVYGNFSSMMYDHQTPLPRLLKCGGSFLYRDLGEEEHEDLNADSPIDHSIWGPTCDGIDMIRGSTTFNRLINIGDWLYFEEMGAYTRASATTFNGFSNQQDVVYVCSEPQASKLLNRYFQE